MKIHGTLFTLGRLCRFIPECIFRAGPVGAIPVRFFGVRDCRFFLLFFFPVCIITYTTQDIIPWIVFCGLFKAAWHGLGGIWRVVLFHVFCT